MNASVYSSDLPTAPGAYWCRIVIPGQHSEDGVTNILEQKGCLIIEGTGGESQPDISMNELVEATRYAGGTIEWAGPIPRPDN